VAELVARTQAILRRAGKSDLPRELLVLADLEMDDDAHEVRRAVSFIDLTQPSTGCFRYLLSNPRRVLTRSSSSTTSGATTSAATPGVLETYVSYLRKKVDSTEPHLIHTVRRSRLRAPPAPHVTTTAAPAGTRAGHAGNQQGPPMVAEDADHPHADRSRSHRPRRDRRCHLHVTTQLPVQQVDDTLSSISAVPGGAVENALLNPGNSELGLRTARSQRSTTPTPMVCC